MPDSNETLLRQILSGQATFAAQLEAVIERVDTASQDAREARDQGNRIATKLEEQNIVARLAEHRAEVRQIVAEIRQDFVAAYTKVRNDMELMEKAHKADLEALDRRIEALEAERNKVIGVAAFAGWLGRAAPWLFAGIAAFIAGAGSDLKDKLS